MHCVAEMRKNMQEIIAKSCAYPICYKEKKRPRDVTNAWAPTWCTQHVLAKITLLKPLRNIQNVTIQLQRKYTERII